MCYPYGSYNEKTISILNDLIFKLGFTNKPNKAYMKYDSFLELPMFDTNHVFSKEFNE